MIVITIVDISTNNMVKIAVDSGTITLSESTFDMLFPGIPLQVQVRFTASAHVISSYQPGAPTVSPALPAHTITRVKALMPVEKPKAVCNCMHPYGHAKWCNAGDWV